MKLFLACTPGLESALAAEATALGFSATAVEGGVEAEGGDDAYESANLWLRCASRVWVRVGQVSRPDDLGRISLAPFRGKDAPVSVDAPARFGSFVQRAWGKSAAHGLEVLIREERHGAEVSVDSSGQLLHFRGYRQEIGRAPMRETLAAGMLALAGYRGDEPLWDVMCGSGTLLIEAAWLAGGRAPGALRHFGFESWPSHQPKRWEARPRVQPRGPMPLLLGSDLNSGALGTARRNAKRAGVFEALTLERHDATRLPVRAGPPGLVVANLPYGIRVGERSELGTLYAALGASLKRAAPGWRFAFLLQEGEETLGLKLDAEYPLDNGGLRCRLVVGRL